MTPSAIQSPDDPALGELCRQLAERADALDASGNWPVEQLALCRSYGVFRAFVPREWGGLDWSEADLMRLWLRLSSACLSTTFVLTQPAGACRRLRVTENAALQARVLPELARGDALASVGISHLTTSGRHLAQAQMVAEEAPGGFTLEGVIPWVTGGDRADYVVTGAALADGRQILALLPTNLAGVRPGEPASLTALSATHTGPIECQGVFLPSEWLLAGPVESVLSQPGSAGAGGVATSALALGLSTAAIDFLKDEARRRADLQPATDALDAERAQLESEVLAIAAGAPCGSTDLRRSRANSLVLRATQGALAAAKGRGFVTGHPAGRWCREALFFLVWSCPQSVMHAALCELAGL